jgi:outer membrane protein OmpA-like peptidoglycan-associated protein
MVLVVERCKSLDQNSPIHNIWVDDDNIKWVANSQGLFKVLALDLVQKVSIPSGKTSLLDIRGGNAKIEWNTADMQNIIGNTPITCASYDAKSKTVWVGTKDEGAFQLSLEPLRAVQKLNMDNKKLTTNQINDIFVQASGKTWIATNDGMLTGSGDKWTLEERYLNFIGVDAWEQNLWILADGLLWQVDSKGKWESIAIEPKNVEGQLRDIAVDNKGRVWIASNMMTGFDVAANRYQRFGPGQYFTSQFVNCLDVDKDGSIWTGTDDKGLYLIQWEAAMTVNILMDTPLDCKTKANTAILSVKVTGGTPPITYTWSNGQTAEKINMLGPGKYAITVTDAKGTVKNAKYEIPDPNFKITTELVSASTGKPEGDGSANLLVDGGTAPLKYTWDNGETIQTPIKLTTGIHAVTVTDASGCSSTASIDIPEKTTALVVFAKFVAENKCADAKDGIAEVEVNGGKSPYTYKWNPGNLTTGKITDLGAGLYSVTVTDAKGQTATTSVNIPAPPPLLATVNSISLAGVNMSNGAAEVKASGGRAPYSYHWDSGEASAKVTTLSGGNHVVTVTDGNGCSTSASLTVQENVNALGVIIKQPVRISCHGIGGASLKVDITGGKPPYSYKWSDGQTAATAEKLNAGKYAVTVTDVLGNSFSSEFTINEPDPIALSTTIDAQATPNNPDGKVTVKASGGTGTLQYAWDNGEKINKAIKLNAGLHTVTVTDAAGCTATAEVTITENISELQLTIEQVSEVKCAGGKEGNIKAVIKGGKAPFTYHWSDNQTTPELNNVGDGLYKLTITDAAGQMATSVITVFSPPALAVEVKADLAASTGKSDGKATITATGGTGKYYYQWDDGEGVAKAVSLKAGNHTLTVTDGNGCSVIKEIDILENILPITVKITQSNKVLCAGQQNASLQSQISGGKPPYKYTWKGNSKTYSEESISNLGAGKYSLSVTDASNLSGYAEFEITEPKPLELSIDEIIPATTNNADGKVILRANGGTSQYSMDGTSVAAGSNTFTIDRLHPGDQLLVVNDAAGCTAQIKVTIPENVLPLTTTIKQTKDILCHGQSDASLEATAKGGKTPLTFAWSTGDQQPVVSNLKEGTYSVTVTDASGQSNKADFNVKAPAEIKLTINNIRSATNDRINDGKANVETAGGSGACTFKWSSGETDHQAVKLPIGPAYVIATDQNGCTAKSEFTINQKVLPELTPARLATGEPIRIEKIQFAADSININPEAIPSLDELYDFLYDNPTIVIEVSGHTNGLPADDYCDRISAERAKSVADYLIGKGIEARRVMSKGYGKRKPVATNQTAEGRKKNQRVEIKFIKIEE